MTTPTKTSNVAHAPTHNNKNNKVNRCFPSSNSRVLISIPEDEITITDHIIVVASSLLIVGSVVWVPLLCMWAWRQWRKIPKEDSKRRTLYGALLMSLLVASIVGPHRHERVGKWLDFKKWRLWQSWIRFVAMEVLLDLPLQHNDNNSNTQPKDHSNSHSSFSLSSSQVDATKDRAILAILPHGIFPFALALSILPKIASQAFGEFRPVVATATALFPFVRSILSWVGAVDATRSSVDRALTEGSRIGLAPGGIAEMFEGYPKPLTHPNDEYAIVRKGFLKMAIKHQVPVIPVYCFGATKMFRRLQLPSFVESLSLLLRVGICVFFGRWGLPIPFRQKLLYVMGRPILPPPPRMIMSAGQDDDDDNNNDSFAAMNERVDEMHAAFCAELVRLFERYKETYGWGRKTLRILDGNH